MKRFNTRLMLTAVSAGFALATFYALSASAAPVAHTTVLTGKVTSIVAKGAQVAEGDALVTVETLTGPMAASRATVSGIVTEVDVTPGMEIARGQQVAVVDGK